MTLRRGIHKARKQYQCDGCRRIIAPGDTYARMFGRAEQCDRMVELLLCQECGHIVDPLMPRDQAVLL
jgi:hypothetical protein